MVEERRDMTEARKKNVQSQLVILGRDRRWQAYELRQYQWDREQL